MVTIAFLLCFVIVIATCHLGMLFVI